jgi:hypothetical protein
LEPVKTNTALVDYAGQLAQDDLLPTRLPDKAKHKKPHGKASGRSYTDAEDAELAAYQAEQKSRVTADQTARPHTPETSCEDIIMSNTPPAGESQGGANTALAIRTPERLQGSPRANPYTLASEPQGTPKAQVESPASTAPARIDQSTRKRRRVPNTLYEDS